MWWIFLVLVAVADASSDVPEEQTVVSTRVCGPNETYYADISCPARNCDVNYTVYECEDRPPQVGCDCKENYSRHPHGSCVLTEECPPAPVCGPNENHYHEKPSCPPMTCDMYYTNKTYLCEGDPREYGCDCMDGYYRRPDGLCVLPDECPVPSVLVNETCDVNERYYDRINCPPLRCDILYTEYTCNDTETIGGCDCIENYLRLSNGTCVLNDDCSPAPEAHSYNATELHPTTNETRVPSDTDKVQKCGVNETYTTCLSRCPRRYCPSEFSGTSICDDLEKCSPGCGCKPDYIWQDFETLICILESECAPANCTRPNEEWNSCATPCEDLCDSISDENEDAEVCTEVCEPRCTCQKGYCRNVQYDCVPEGSYTVSSKENLKKNVASILSKYFGFHGNKRHGPN